MIASVITKSIEDYENIELRKHSAMIQVSNPITAQQRKIFNSMLYAARDQLHLDPEKRLFEMSLSEVRMLGGITDTNWSRTKQSLEELNKIKVEFNLLGKDKAEWRVFSLISEARIIDGSVYFEFPSTIRDRIQRPDIFADLDLRVIRTLKGKHAVALYEVLADYRKVHSLRVSVLRLRAMFGILENQYPNFNMLRKRVIDPAIKEINEKTDINASYELRKRGRKVVEVKFSIKPSISLPDQKLFDTINVPGSPVTTGNEQKQPDSITQDLIAEISSFNVPVALAEEWVEEYTSQHLKNSIDYLKEKMEEGGIQKPGGYLRTLVEKGQLGPSAFEEEQAERREVKARKLREKNEHLSSLKKEFMLYRQQCITDYVDNSSEEDQITFEQEVTNRYLPQHLLDDSGNLRQDQREQFFRDFIADRYLPPEDEHFDRWLKRSDRESSELDGQLSIFS